jgi:acid phosphatase (class A)
MIKLKELLELRGMVYSEEIKPKHQKKIDMKTSLWDENIVIPKITPPENDSSKTLKEVKYLSKIKPNNEFAESGDDVKENFMPLIEKNGLNVTKEFLSKIIKESSKFIMELKYHYNRPRPYQIAEFYDIDLNGTTLNSMKTPSFPSGHAVQGYLIGEYLSFKDPRMAHEYKQAGEDVAHSRIIAKAHYPSDKEYGKIVARALFRGMKR